MCHVLIIEDEALVALDLQLLLESCGATSFSFAATEREAVEAAKDRRPEFISSDVKLAQGTGPRAVATILQEVGSIPVIFITGTPEECEPCEPPARIFSKPLLEAAVSSAFREMAPI